MKSNVYWADFELTEIICLQRQEKHRFYGHIGTLKVVLRERGLKILVPIRKIVDNKDNIRSNYME